MSFKDFGVRSFVPETGVAGFADLLREGKVMASRCCGCGHLSFPPRSGCTSCGSSEYEWAEITGSGTLLTYTKVMYGPAGFESEVPYTLAVAAFPMGINVFGQLAPELTAGEIEVGMKLSLATRRLPEGRVSYHFLAA